MTFLKKHQEEYPIEKAYLHLDKSTYTLGEVVWFSAYLTAGSTQVPSPLSKVLYVDLFDSGGELLSQKKIGLEDGYGDGYFKLPDFGEEGVFTVKAYSAWMSNFGKEYFFQKDIEVFDGASSSFYPKVDFKVEDVKDDKVYYQINLEAVNGQGEFLANEDIEIRVVADEVELERRKLMLNKSGLVTFSLNLPLKPFQSQWLELMFFENDEYAVRKKVKIPYSFLLADIQFMPEGGHLVSGLRSRVAFKGVYPDGSPATFEGEVLNSEENIKFSTFFGGMGMFEIVPEENKEYKVKVYDSSNNQFQELKLPKSSENGLVMQVINKPELSYVTVFIQGNYQEGELVLVSHTRGFINFMLSGELLNGIWGLRIPKEYLFSGINHVSVLNSRGEPLLERLFFFQSEKNEVVLNVSKKGDIDKRKEIELDINSPQIMDAFGGRFSVSIVDEGQLQSNSTFGGTIFSELLLCSDLKGKVIQPGYYFEDKDEDRLQALDLVMMTNGWRRFSWGDLKNDNFPEINRLIERGLRINGSIIELRKTKKGISGGKVNAIVGQGEIILSEGFAEDGRFSFTDLDFVGDKEVSLSAIDDRLNNNVEIKIDSISIEFEKINPKVKGDLKIPKELMASFQERNLMNKVFEEDQLYDLEGVEVKAESIQDEEERAKKMYGEGDVIIKPDEIGGGQAFMNIFELIQGRVSGVKVNTSMMNPSVVIRGVGSVTGGTQPLYLLDNMPVDAATLMSINPRDVSSIDVFKDAAKAAIFGSQGANGAIAVYTKSGSQIYQKSPGNMVARLKGFSESREFYHPKYDVITPENSIPDKRSTIYWNPSLVFDETGVAKIKYYNSDIAKKHLVIIEGIDSKGRIGRYEQVLE
ncbi:TonB-dependent receptor plug domain-containing protein [Belliella marina]